MKKSPRLIPDSETCRRYGVVPYTLWRWDHGRPEVGFPRPVRINGRKYRVEAELDEFDARRAAERDAHPNDQGRLAEANREASAAHAGEAA